MSKRLQVTFDDGSYALVTHRAAAEGQTPSAWMRQLGEAVANTGLSLEEVAERLRWNVAVTPVFTEDMIAAAITPRRWWHRFFRDPPPQPDPVDTMYARMEPATPDPGPA